MTKSRPILSMQENLSILRKICGWTTEELGLRIGVTKQTISNLENYKVNMTKTQYIALRTVFEYEINCVKDNSTLNKVMMILFYSEIDYDSDTEARIKENLNNLAAAASGGINGTQLSLLASTLLAPLRLPVLCNTIYQSNEPYSWLEQLKEN